MRKLRQEEVSYFVQLGAPPMRTPSRNKPAVPSSEQESSTPERHGRLWGPPQPLPDPCSQAPRDPSARGKGPHRFLTPA